MKVLTEYQAIAILSVATGTRFEAIYYLAITTGLRQGELLEVTLDGQIVKSYDISFSGIFDLSGVAIGPDSQGTGDTSIYVTSRGIDNDYDPNENDGKVYEFAFKDKLYLPMLYR